MSTNWMDKAKRGLDARSTNISINGAWQDKAKRGLESRGGYTPQPSLTTEDYKNFSASLKKQLADCLTENKGNFDGKKVRELTKQYAGVQTAIYQNNLKNGFTGITPIGENIANLYKAHGYDFQKLFPDLYDAYSTGNIEAFAYQNSEEFKTKVDNKHKSEVDKVLFGLGKTFNEQIKTAEDELAVLEEKQYAMGFSGIITNNSFIRPTSNYSVEDIVEWENKGVDFGEEIASKKAEIESTKAYYTSVSEVFKAKSRSDFEENNKYIFGKTPDKGQATSGHLPKGFYEVIAKEHSKSKRDLTFTSEDGSTYTVTVDKNGLTEDEYGTLMYILNTQGTEAADKFYDGIEFNRNSNIAQSVHDALQEMEKGGLFQKLGAGIGETAYALASGVEGLIMAPVNMVADMTGNGGGYYAPTVSQQITAKNIESADGLGRIGLQATQTAPQIAGVVGASVLGGPIAANVFLAATVFPSSYVDARNRGASEGQAFTKASLDTALELATERFLGNTIEGSGTTFTGLVGSAVKKTGIGAKVFDFFSDVASKYPNIGTGLRLAGKSGGSGISEMAEEYTASFFAPGIENTVYGTTKKAEVWNEEEKESSAVGFITGLILGEARNVKLYSYMTNGDYGSRIAEIYSLSDEAVTADYLKNIDISTLTEIAKLENADFDSLSEQEQAERVARVKSRIENGITPEEARVELLEEETLRATIFGMEDFARQGYTYEAASDKLRKQGVDVGKYSEFAKQAYEMGELKKPLMPEISSVAVEMAREGKSSSEIADKLISSGKESNTEIAIRTANAAKNKVFSEALTPEMTVAQRQKAMQDRIVAENKAEEEYFAEKYNNMMSEAKETLGEEFHQSFVSDAVNKISNNLLKKFSSETTVRVSAGRLRNAVLEAIVSRGEVSKENITRQLADAFAVSMPVASKAYQTLSSSGVSATDALVNYALKGEIPDSITDKASFEVVGERFKAVSESAVSQVSNARLRAFNGTVASTEGTNDVSSRETVEDLGEKTSAKPSLSRDDIGKSFAQSKQKLIEMFGAEKANEVINSVVEISKEASSVIKDDTGKVIGPMHLFEAPLEAMTVESDDRAKSIIRADYNMKLASEIEDSKVRTKIKKFVCDEIIEERKKLYSAGEAVSRNQAVEDIARSITEDNRIDDSVIDYSNSGAEGKVNWNDLSKEQQRAISFVKKTAEKFNLKLKLVPNGEGLGINGAYVAENDAIIVDVYAGVRGYSNIGNAIISTMSHEMTHWMKSKATALYNKIDSLVFKALEKSDGKSREDRIRDEMKNLGTESYEEARDEIIARACEDMLAKSEFGKDIYSKLTKPEKKTFGQMVREIFGKAKANVSELLSEYKSSSKEATALRKFDSELGEISKAWNEALEQISSENGVSHETEKTSEVTVAKSGRKSYNEYNTNGMQWAYDYSTKVGDRRILFDPRTQKYALIEATKEGVGFIELSVGTLEETERDIASYEKHRQGEYSDDKRLIDSEIHNFKTRQNNDTRNNVDAGHRAEGVRNAEVSEGKLDSNRTADSSKTDGTVNSLKASTAETKSSQENTAKENTTEGGVKFSLRNKNLNFNDLIPFIEHDNFVNVNKGDKTALNDLKSKVRNLKRGMYQNDATEYKATISSDTIGKAIKPTNQKFNEFSDYYIRNLNAILKLPELFKTAVYVDSKGPQKAKAQNPSYKEYHHFVAPLFMDNTEYRALITAREKKNSDTLYVLKVEVLPTQRGHTKLATQQKAVGSQWNSVPSDISIADLINGVKIKDYDTGNYDVYQQKDILFSRRVTPEQDADFIETQSELGNLRYIDKEKNHSWSQSRGLQLPKLADTISDSTNNILQKEDIVNSILFKNEDNDTWYSQRRKKVTTEDIEKFDYSQYNEIKLPYAEQERVQSEFLTWHADIRNQLIPKTLSNGTTYRCVIDDDGIVHVYSKKTSQNVHEGVRKFYANNNTEELSSLAEELWAGRGNDGFDSGSGRDGRKPRRNDSNDNFSLSSERRSDGAGYSKNRPHANRKPKEYKFNDDGTIETTYSDGTTEKTRYSVKNKGEADPLSERFNSEKNDIRFNMRSPVEESGDLVAVHNLNSYKLNEAIKLGGFPGISVAITKADMGHTGFGDISVVLRKETVDPAVDDRVKLYSGDAFTPTTPAYSSIIDKAEANRLKKEVDIFAKNHGLKGKLDNPFSSEFLKQAEGTIDFFRHEPALMAMYLDSIGKFGEIDTNGSKYKLADRLEEAIENDADYDAWESNVLNTIVKGKRFRNDTPERGLFGIKRSDNELYDDYTAENIVSRMKQDTNLAHIKTIGIDEYSSIDEAKANADKLGFDENASEKYSAIEEKFYRLAEKVSSEDRIDETQNELLDILYNNKDITKAKEEFKNQFADVYTEDLGNEFVSIAEEVKDIPSKYFEAKLYKVTSFDELAAIVVPDNIDADLKAKLGEMNVNLVEYEHGNNESRINVLNSVEGARFSRRGVDNQSVGEYNLNKDSGEEDLYDKETETRRHTLAGRRGRADVQDSRKQGGGIFGRAGTLTERSREDRQATARLLRTKLLTKKTLVGKTELELIDKKSYTDDMLEIVAYNKKQGVRTFFFVGQGTRADKPLLRCNGMHRSNGEVYLSYDYGGSLLALNRHELVHHFFDTEVMQKISQVFQHTIGNEKLNEIYRIPAYQRYLNLYEGDTSKVFEEVVADTFSGINKGETHQKVSNFVSALWNGMFDEIDAKFNELGLELTEKTQKNPKHINYSLADDGMWDFDDVWRELVEEYGAIPKGEKPARDISVPKKTEEDKPVSRTVRTVLEAEATPDEVMPDIASLVKNGDFSYDVYTDEKAISNAENRIKKHGWADSLSTWLKDVEHGTVSKEQTAMGWALYNNAANSGDVDTAMTILDAMVKHQRSAAQALQASRILKKLSPDTQLYGVQKSIDSLEEELIGKYKEKAPKLKINDKLAEEFLNAETQEERDEILKEIYRDIGRQMPSTWIDKWNAWRYISMLGNFRTHVRNILGNAIFAPVVQAKDLTATAIESIVHGVTGRRTEKGKSFVSDFSKKDRTLLKSAWDDYKNVADTVSNGGKYGDFANANKYIEEGRVIFKGLFNGRFNPLEWARKGNSKLLDLEDAWFSQPHYAYALVQYCKAHGISPEQISSGKGLEAARQYAIKEAQKATYRDTNYFSQMVSEWGRSNRSKNPAKKAFGTVVEGILPFRKTPANILVRGVEYSPIGLLKGLTYDLHRVSKGEIKAYEAIDNISAGLTGTGLLALGAYLAAQGLIRGHGEDEEEEKEFMELLGHQSYALELPNGTSITLDWLAPEALPFFVGVNLWETVQRSGGEMNLSDILGAISNITEPMLEMSCLQSLNDLFESIGYASSNDGSSLTSIITSSLTSYLSQGIPTLFGQLERTLQDSRMTTYTEKNAFLTGDMQYTLGKWSAKIPGWDFNQIPYIDAWGRKEASEKALERGFNNFLNPAYMSKVEMSDMEKELLRLYELTGDSAVLPDRAKKYFTSGGERIDLTAEQYIQYAMDKGQKSYTLITNLVNSEAYMNLSDLEKIRAIDEAFKYADEKAKQAILDSHKSDKWVGTADGFGDESVGNYFAFRAGVQGTRSDNGGKILKDEVIEIIKDTAETDDEAWDMYLSEYDSKGSKYAKDNGIDGNTYIDFLKVLGDVDKPTESGEYGTYTQEEVKEAIKRLKGLSKKEKAVLWQSVNTKWKNNPYK